MNLHELNNKYYGLFGDLYFNRALLSERQHKTMSRVLETEYEKELDICLMEKALGEGEANFNLRFRAGAYIPRRTWFFGRHNVIGRKLLKVYKVEFMKALAELDKSIVENKADANTVMQEVKQLHETFASNKETALTVKETQHVAPESDSGSDVTFS